MSSYIFDLIVIVLILLSAGLGFLRGFCNEIFTIFGWIGAVLATIILTPLSRDVLRAHIHNAIIADLTTAAIIFIVTMVVFSVISHYATRSPAGQQTERGRPLIGIRLRRVARDFIIGPDVFTGRVDVDAGEPPNLY